MTYRPGPSHRFPPDCPPVEPREPEPDRSALSWVLFGSALLFVAFFAWALS